VRVCLCWSPHAVLACSTCSLHAAPARVPARECAAHALRPTTSPPQHPSQRPPQVLLHDFPEFLSEHHFLLCNNIPPTCVQMRNLILSAFPRNMRLPDPFTPNLKVRGSWWNRDGWGECCAWLCLVGAALPGLAPVLPVCHVQAWAHVLRAPSPPTPPLTHTTHTRTYARRPLPTHPRWTCCLRSRSPRACPRWTASSPTPSSAWWTRTCARGSRAARCRWGG